MRVEGLRSKRGERREGKAVEIRKMKWEKGEQRDLKFNTEFFLTYSELSSKGVHSSTDFSCDLESPNL